MDRPHNPFILGHRISRPYFCDRIEEQRNLTSAVLNGRNVVMISPRRMGKTSLIYISLHESKEIDKDYITFFLDILQTNSLSEFTYLLGKAVFDKLSSKSISKVKGFLAALKSLKGTFGFDPLTGSPTFDLQLGDIKNPEYTLEEIFNYIEKSEKNVIIIVDEFQQITKYPEKNTEALLRTNMQRLTRSSFVFACSERTLLQEMFISSARPFYNSADIMHIGPIEEDVYVDFASKLFEERGKSIDEESVRWVFHLFDGNTFYMQRTMNGAFADTDAGERCNHATLVRSVKAMIAANEIIYREILSNISVAQKAILLAIAQERNAVNPMSSRFIKKYSLTSASSVQSGLIKLMKMSLVSKTEGIYSIADPLLRIFINELYSTSELPA
ncbi:MAG: ATP-binding protein [Muribaculaceae bacterium]|nr:ATP-binding protein [Muribaculaceae bacterium]